MRSPALLLASLLVLGACADVDEVDEGAGYLDEGEAGGAGGGIAFGAGGAFSPVPGTPPLGSGGAAAPTSGGQTGAGGVAAGGFASAGGFTSAGGSSLTGAGGGQAGAGGARSDGAGGACTLPLFCPAGGSTGAGGGVASGAGGAFAGGGAGGAEAESLPGFTPLPANPKECPVGAPANPVGSCLGLPIYVGCNYTNGQRQYSCVCDWYHWLCI